jgi:hypothetical protein
LGWFEGYKAESLTEINMSKKPSEGSEGATHAIIAKEMAKPRMARSAKIAQLKLDTSRTPEQRSTNMPATVDKIIPSQGPGQPEKAQIVVAEADRGYRDLRIENILVDENGDDVRLQMGSPVEVTVRAYPKNVHSRKH